MWFHANALFVGTYKVTSFCIFCFLVNNVQEFYLFRGGARGYRRRGMKGQYFKPKKKKKKMLLPHLPNQITWQWMRLIYLSGGS